MAPKAPRTPAAEPKKAGCAVGEVFRLLGESYVLDILHLFLSEESPRRFVDVQDTLKMSPNTLSDRLRSLVKCGLLTRTPYSEIPPRVDYQATPKAKELAAVFEDLTLWAERNDLRPLPAATV